MTDIRLRVRQDGVIRIRELPAAPVVRLRVLPSLLPLEIELQSDGTNIQWRYVGGSTDWTDLIAVTEISGTIEVGTVTSLPPGSLPTVVNVGTDQHAIFDFGIPSGDVLEPLIITTAGTYSVDATTNAVVVNLASSGSVTLDLPPAASRNGIPLSVADWGGNATITLTPDAGDTGGIMGLTSATLASAGQGLGTGAITTLNPNTTLAGWFAS